MFVEGGGAVPSTSTTCSDTRVHADTQLVAAAHAGGDPRGEKNNGTDLNVILLKVDGQWILLLHNSHHAAVHIEGMELGRSMAGQGPGGR